MSEKYTLIGFNPGEALQASELNEIQNDFYLQQTFNNTILFNWFKMPPNWNVITGYSSDRYYPTIWHGAVPLNPIQMQADNVDGSILLTFKSGWYGIWDRSFYKWIKSSSDRTLSLIISELLMNEQYSVCVSVASTTVLVSQDPNNEGYGLNDNSLGVISSLTGGASRIRYNINEIRAFEASEVPSNFLILCKLTKFQEPTGSSTIKIQYPNNYLIKTINT